MPAKKENTNECLKIKEEKQDSSINERNSIDFSPKENETSKIK